MPKVADVIRDLGGPEVIRGRFRVWWRGGDGLSGSAKDEQWYDHVTGKGGGPLQLAEAVLGEAEGRRWFRDRYGLALCRQRAARRAPVVADELLRRMVAALADMRKQVADDDEDELARWSPLDRIARAGGDEWRKWRERAEISDPEGYRHLVKCTIEFEADCRRIAALIVAMLAVSLE